MIESGFKRAFYALGIFIAGLHLVGFGIWKNGDAYASNPTWRFIQNVWSFELLLLKIIFGCLFVYVLTLISKSLATKDEPKKSKSETEKPPENYKLEHLPQPIKPQVHSIPNTVTVVDLPRPESLPAEELKRRALKQITGKEFK